MTSRDAITLRDLGARRRPDQGLRHAPPARRRCAAARKGLTDRQVTVTLPGGPLDIEWRADGHVLMTGPVELEFEGALEPDAAVARAGHERPSKLSSTTALAGRGYRVRRASTTRTVLLSSALSCRSPRGARKHGQSVDHHPRLPAQRLRVGGDARAAPPRPGSTTRSSSTPARSPPRPCARRRRRSASCGASTLRHASSSPAAPRRSSPSASPRMPEVDRVIGNAEKMQRRDASPSSRLAGSARVQVNDIMCGARDGACT